MTHIFVCDRIILCRAVTLATKPCKTAF